MIKINQIRECWEANAGGWAEAVSNGWDKYRQFYHDPAFFDLLGPVADLRVLDIGCGEGVTLRALSGQGCAALTGIDLSPSLVAAARASSDASIDFAIDDFGKLLSIESEAWDRVISVMALMDSPDLAKIAGVVHRVLKEGGEFVFSVTHPIVDRPANSWVDEPERGKRGMLVSDYFRTEPWIDEWSFSSGPEGAVLPMMRIPTFPRTVSGYVNTLVATGFSVVQVLEPQVTEPACERFPALRRWRDIPFYLMFRVRKEAHSTTSAKER